MRKIIGIPLVLLSVLGSVIWTACDSSNSKGLSGASVESLTLGTSANDLSSLIWLAKGRGYFAEQGLDINIKSYESGHLALRNLLSGKADLATATEFATAHRVLERPDLRIISILGEAQDQQVVARRDHGITQASDLRNKRVGVTHGSSAEYYLHIMLILQKISPQEVQMVDLLPSELVTAIKTGVVDAVIVWEPWATMAKEELGGNAVSWPGQGGKDEYWLLLSTDAVISKRSRAIGRFVAALTSAEDFLKNENEEAKRLVASQLGPEHQGSLWKNHRFRLRLHHSLILTMEAEIRWLNRRNGAAPSPMPNLLDFIYFDALDSVKPEKIKLLR